MNGHDDEEASPQTPLRDLLRMAEQEAATGQTPEYRKLFLAVARIATHLSNETNTVSTIIRRLDRHETVLLGDADHPGLKASMDTLIGEMRSSKKMRAAILTSIITLIIAAVWNLLTNHKP